MNAREYVLWRERPGAADAARAATMPNRLRFGHEVIYVGADGEAAGRAGVERLAGGQQAARLHLVVQVGNRFEAEHPEVPVLYRKGRYLLVDIDPHDAAAQARTGCYAVQLIQMPQVVYEERPRVDRRARARADIRELVGLVSPVRLKETVQKFASFETRHSTSTSFRQAAEAARATLERAGCEVTFRTVPLGSQQTFNVVASRPGSGPSPRGTIAVTAHLDSVNHENPGQAAPGADDNASGAAGVLEIAMCLAGRPHTEDLQFILFGGEEQGLFGSLAHVTGLAPAHGVRAVVNMDMIATINATASPTVLIEGAPVSQTLIDTLADVAATYTGLTVQTSLHAFNSDHVPFIEAGIPAVLLIEGNDASNNVVHTSRDTMDRIDSNLMADIVRMPLAFVADAAGVSAL